MHDERGGEEAVFLEGKLLIRQENMAAVHRLLEQVSGQNRVGLLLELGKQRWQDSHAHQADLDTALAALFHRAERLDESLKDQRWKEKSHFLLGVIYRLKKDAPKSKSYFSIPMHDCIQEVVAYLHESYCLDQLVRFCVEVAPIELDVTQAEPLGLIINEVITNAFKYAFPDGRSGTVCLSLQRHGEAAYQLPIADDGVGLPANYDLSRSPSLGMTLLHGFSGQLGGELTITSPPGLSISLVFEEEQLSLVFAPVAQAG